MTQKVIEVIGASPVSFAKAAENAAAEAARSVQGVRWARITEFDMALNGAQVLEYRVTARVFFDA